MTITGLRVLGALAVLGFGAAANAASVNITPTSVDGALIGDIITFEISIDFTDDPTLGGGFDVNWDPNALQLVSFSDTVILGDPAFGRPPDDCAQVACVGGLGAGTLQSWGVGDFAGLTFGVVGQVSFEVLAGAIGGTIVALGPTQGIAGPWVSAIDFVSIIEPDYGSATVTAVPVPAAVWFMLSGLAALFGIRRQAA